MTKEALVEEVIPETIPTDECLTETKLEATEDKIENVEKQENNKPKTVQKTPKEEKYTEEKIETQSVDSADLVSDIEEQKSTISHSITCRYTPRSCPSTPRYDETCQHRFMVEEFREKIIRIEKEKEYLEGKYDELRREKPLYDSYRRQSNDSQYTANDMYTPRCECHCSRRDRSNKSTDSDYYKRKCDIIRKEKENLELAYQGERLQKEDIEREYENERNEKQFVERRYETMLQSITRFEDTIRELRHENENLQANLHEWTNIHKAQSDAFSSKFEDIVDHAFSEDSSSDIYEYRRSLELLERENKEFREILEVLSKKNENQDSLKGIELGLVREKEFLDLKRQRAKLEDIVREQKRTIGHQQERIEEIRQEHEDEIHAITDANRKNERKLKEMQKSLDEKDREIDDMKRVKVEEIHMLEIKLQSESSYRSQYQGKINELEIKIQRLENDKIRLQERINTSAASERFNDEAYGENITVIRQRYEDEQRSKVKLANDIKYLLQDIIDLKERNRRMEDDVNRERMEIKNMLEKQANEITQVYLTQITKLQGALSDEMRRREMLENGINQNVSSGYVDQTYQSKGAGNNMIANSNRQGNNMDSSLREEIKKREALEVENKNLLYEMNKLLSGLSMDDQSVESSPHYQAREPSRGVSGNTGLQKKNKELMNEIAELKDSLEDMESLVRKNKGYKNKIEDLLEELDHMTRKRDEIAGLHRNMKRDVEQLSMTLDEVQRKNRQYTDECDRLMRRIQELEDSFKFEKSKMLKNHEAELESVLAEKEVRNEELQRQVEQQSKVIDMLKEKAAEAGYELDDVHDLTDNRIANNDTKNKGDPYISALKKQLEKLENKLKDTSKRHDEEIKSVEKQKKEMKADFEKEKQELKQFFNQEKKSLERQFQQPQMLNEVPRAAMTLNSLPVNDFNNQNASNIIAPEEAFTAQEAVFGLESLPSSSPGLVSGPQTHGLPGNTSPGQNGLTGNGFPGQHAPGSLGNEAGRLDNGAGSLGNGGSVQTMNFNGNSSPSLNQGFPVGHVRKGPGSDFEMQVRDVEQRFAQDKYDILQKSAEEKRKLQQDIYNQRGNQEYGRNDDISQAKGSIYSQSPRAHLEQANYAKIKEQHQKALSDVQNLQKKIQKQRLDYEGRIKRLNKEKQELDQSLQALNQEISGLRCERKNIKCHAKSELVKAERLHEIEKTEIRETLERRRKDEIFRLRSEYDDRMAKERKRLQNSSEELRLKVTTLETKLRDVEVILQNERHKAQRERSEFQKTLVNTKEEYKAMIDGEYKKRLCHEKHKFEKTLRELRQQIAALQEQRKQIQLKLSSKDVGSQDRVSRERMILQIEQEFFDKLEKEKKPLEEKISDLKDEISKMKREKSVIKTTMEKEKDDLKDEVERVKDNMKDKLQRAKDEMERRSEMISRSMASNRNLTVS